jgi:hypothetical protein
MKCFFFVLQEMSGQKEFLILFCFVLFFPRDMCAEGVTQIKRKMKVDWGQESEEARERREHPTGDWCRLDSEVGTAQ